MDADVDDDVTSSKWVNLGPFAYGPSKFVLMRKKQYPLYMWPIKKQLIF